MLGHFLPINGSIVTLLIDVKTGAALHPGENIHETKKKEGEIFITFILFNVLILLLFFEVSVDISVMPEHQFSTNPSWINVDA